MPGGERYMIRELLQLLRSEFVFALVTASFTAVTAVVAFEVVGYLGIALLGLVTLLICANVELGKDAPFGGINTPELHASSLRHESRMTCAERAERRSEVDVLVRSLFFVRLIGRLFVLVGLGGFFLVQLR
jgi:hypothetical protein